MAAAGVAIRKRDKIVSDLSEQGTKETVRLVALLMRKKGGGWNKRWILCRDAEIVELMRKVVRG